MTTKSIIRLLIIFASFSAGVLCVLGTLAVGI